MQKRGVHVSKAQASKMEPNSNHGNDVPNANRANVATVRSRPIMVPLYKDCKGLKQHTCVEHVWFGKAQCKASSGTAHTVEQTG